MKFRTRKQAVWLSCMMAFVLFLLCAKKPFNHNAYAAKVVRVPAVITASKAVVRVKPGQAEERLKSDKKDAVLCKGKELTITGQTRNADKVWYHILFKEDGTNYSGYIASNQAELTLKNVVKAEVSSNGKIPVYKKPDGKSKLQINGKEYELKNGRTVTIHKEITNGQKKWFYVSFQSGSSTYYGYIQVSEIKFLENAEEEQKSPSPSTAPSKPQESVKPSSNPVKKVSKEEAGTVCVVTKKNAKVYQSIGEAVKTFLMNGKNVTLKEGDEVTLKAVIQFGTKKWYQVSFLYEDKKVTGYVKDSELKQTDKKASQEESPVPSPSYKPLTDAEFEASLTSEGFPSSYKSSLRALHKQYPLWRFKAYQTGYDWNTAVEKENKVGKNLITNARGYGWKSTEEGAYNWAKDRFIRFDGSTWVTVSKKALKYYMDPRNFLNAQEIFQFEYLSYEKEFQQLAGVESILKNTIMYDKEFTYKDSAGKKQTTTFGEAFMDAAAYSQVNPFHLATRVKQEVITSSGFSNSATGCVSGYEGYYNFYNIGATHSTKAGGAVLNGLKFSKTGNGMSGDNKILYMLPWTSPYNAIVGGAKYIGNNYINRGQNTVYLQKFNATPASSFSHQYMANVEAAWAEAQKTYTAYKDFNDIPVVFHIPIYRNMPAKKAAAPSDNRNPNNWLKSLDITGQIMEPEFKITDSESEIYTVLVDDTADYITINASAVSQKADITGDGIWKIDDGKNIIKVKVKAENGDVRTYTIYVLRA